MNKYIMLMIASMMTMPVCSQRLVNSTGFMMGNTNLQIDYSLGEILTTTLQVNQGALTQGLLQPNYSIFSETNEVFDKKYHLSVYPNPITNRLIVLTDYPGFTKYQILNLHGQTISEGPLYNNTIDLPDVPSGLYIIKFQADGIFKSIIANAKWFCKKVKIDGNFSGFEKLLAGEI